MKVSKLIEGTPWQDQDFEGERLGRTVCIQRYGGFGDMMQMSSILPGLRDQGYKITVNTDTTGYEIVKNNPYIDEIFLQKTDQVPNEDLGDYWDALSKCFTKFIMLSESVERSLLAIPEMREAAWHQDFRRMVMGSVDYIEATHAIAEVPLPPKIKFYPTDKEKVWANGFLRSLGKNQFNILWSLSGSSVHKTWPYLDMIIARMMSTFSNVNVITCGDASCQMLECGWENEKRVIRKSGKWSIRETLTVADRCDLVIGPETGVMSSSSMQEVPKILMLSHSSIQNIGKNWVNTHVMTPDNTPCYPCHILHRGFGMCHKDEETGTSLCNANLDPEKVWAIIFDIISTTKGIRK